MNICSKCGFEGNEDLFVKRGRWCKNCNNSYLKSYRENNKDSLKIKKKSYYQENRENIIQQKREYYRDNKEKMLEYMKQRYVKNKDAIDAYKKEYSQINKDKIRQYHNNYDKNKRDTDPTFRLRKNCSRLIHYALKGSKNNFSILNYLPYSMEELKVHLEKQFSGKMSWDNYGSYWHIDHIVPQSKLIYSSMTDDNFHKCWALSNLRPLEAIENMKKGNKSIL